MAASTVYNQPQPQPAARQPSRFELGELDRLRKENERLKRENKSHVYVPQRMGLYSSDRMIAVSGQQHKGGRCGAGSGGRH